MFSSIGRLVYSSGYRLIVECDSGVADFYRSLIPRYYDWQKPRWAAHITVVRAEKEKPVHLEYWGRYHNQEIEWFYDPTIRMGKIYFWLNTFCKRLEEIRLELGLPLVSSYTRPPDSPFAKCFHMTIANYKL